MSTNDESWKPLFYYHMIFTCSAAVLSSHGLRLCYRLESLHPLGRLVTRATVRTAIKELLCTTTWRCVELLKGQDKSKVLLAALN
jgi:hypothetical protein